MGANDEWAKHLRKFAFEIPAYGQFNAYTMPGAQNPGTTLPPIAAPCPTPIRSHGGYQTTVVTTTRHTVGTNITRAPRRLRCNVIATAAADDFPLNVNLSDSTLGHINIVPTAHAGRLHDDHTHARWARARRMITS